MEKKKMKLKLNSEAITQIDDRRTSFAEPIFAFATVPSNRKISNVTQLTYCRESICEYVRQQLRSVRSYDIDLTKLRMIIYRKVRLGKSQDPKIFLNQVATGLTMLNAIEKNYGWPLTRVYPTKNDQNISPNCMFYYIVASRRWIKAPVMLSLFTLLFRIAKNETKFKFGHRIKTMKSMFTVLDELAQKSGDANIKYYEKHGDRWELILNNYKSLFGARNISDLYFPNNSGYFFTEGINELCDESSQDPVLNKQFQKIVQREEGKRS